jgi:polyferredoxin
VNDASRLWQFLANAVLVSHVTLMIFVVLGLPLIAVGCLRGWRVVTSPWFRFAHLATILVVAGEAWLGIVCPLTTLEMVFRTKAQAGAYEGSFVDHWLQALLFWNASAWVFTTAYSLFGLAVLATWWAWPVRIARRGAAAQG